MENKKDEMIYCNQCGQVIGEKDYPKKDFLKVNKKWGYFSEKDLHIHEFCLCESCYDEMVGKFKMPPKLIMNNEAM